MLEDKDNLQLVRCAKREREWNSRWLHREGDTGKIGRIWTCEHEGKRPECKLYSRSFAEYFHT